MERMEKIEYTIRLLLWIGLLDEKISYVENELCQKEEQQIDALITKLERYHTDRHLLDSGFIQKLNKIGNDMNETMEATVERSRLNNFSI